MNRRGFLSGLAATATAVSGMAIASPKRPLEDEIAFLDASGIDPSEPNNEIARLATFSALKWPRAAGPFLAAVKLEGRLPVVLYQAAKGSGCC